MRAFLAQVAELVDALGSGPSARKGVEVRVLSWAPRYYYNPMFSWGFLFLGLGLRSFLPQFIALLQSIDAYYPPEAIVRVVLNNHSLHISKETMA